ncbi:MAG: GTP-binding protein [Burkholderiaceae bacterium]
MLTGNLGSGKATLIERVLREKHGAKIAVIENESGKEGIDNDLLMIKAQEKFPQRNDGRIRCTIRDDLHGALRMLVAKKRNG